MPAVLVETALAEAVARRLRADLVIRAIRPGAETRLISRFLGLSDDGDVILEVPRTVRGDLVYVPEQWRVGVSWEMGGQLVQFVGNVTAHPQFALHPTLTIDALQLRRPHELLLSERRREVRHNVKSSQCIRVELWLDPTEQNAPVVPPYGGKLLNRSAGGLGIAMPVKLPWTKGAALLARVQGDARSESGLFRANLAYCVADNTYRWRVGLSNVHAVEPGQSPALVAALLQRRTRGATRTSRDQDSGPATGESRLL